eukprot:2262776-Prymnesium_polylepis.1
MAVLPTQPPFPPAPLRKQQLSDDVFEDAQQLTKAEAAELRAVVRALYDDDALEDFLDEHCDEFECYAGRDGEQQLGWTPLHTAYVALMEERIEAALEQTPLQSSDSLFALLRRVQGTDERASAFILCAHSQLSRMPPHPGVIERPALRRSHQDHPRVHTPRAPQTTAVHRRLRTLLRHDGRSAARGAVVEAV